MKIPFLKKLLLYSELLAIIHFSFYGFIYLNWSFQRLIFDGEYNCPYKLGSYTMSGGLDHSPAPPQADCTQRCQQIWPRNPRHEFERNFNPNRDRPLNLNWRCNIEEFTASIELPVPPSSKASRAQAAIIADAQLAALHDPQRRISYSRRNGWWQTMRRYCGADFSFYTVIPTIDGLVEAGILVDHDLRPSGWASGIQSSFRPAPWLADIALPRLTYEVKELIRLKDADGKLVAYKDNDKVCRDRVLVSKINKSITEADIRINSPEASVEGEVVRFGSHAVYTAKKTLYRVYNGSWSLGGRFYGGWWQSCPSRYRKDITINGCATVELDYSQIHPRLLYDIAKHSFDGDAYAIPGWDRRLGKIAFNIMLNAPTLQSAQMALANELRGDIDAAKELIEDTKARHPKIHDLFHTGMGLKLQNVDSEMCRYILSELHKNNIVALPIHDSFIVASEYEILLKNVMHKALIRALSN